MSYVFALCMTEEEEEIPIPSSIPVLTRRTPSEVLAPIPGVMGVASSSRVAVAVPLQKKKTSRSHLPITMECLQEDSGGVEAELTSGDDGSHSDKDDADQSMPDLGSTDGTSATLDEGTFLTLWTNTVCSFDFMNGH